MFQADFNMKCPLRMVAAIALSYGVLCASPGHAAVGLRAPLVSTEDGLLRGRPRPGGGAEFLGIPYAEPPVGPLRWAPPVPVKPWRGVRSAVRFGAPCLQPPLGTWNERAAATGRENCLYLNVIVPRWPMKRPLPVMFWIHGGANIGGTGTRPLYNFGTLVEHGVILVTIDYRLGIFGFLADPALSRESAHHASGDYGLMDQILALRWVRANIARFGGDPHNITVFGQSAGANDPAALRMLARTTLSGNGKFISRVVVPNSSGTGASCPEAKLMSGTRRITRPSTSGSGYCTEPRGSAESFASSVRAGMRRNWAIPAGPGFAPKAATR